MAGNDISTHREEYLYLANLTHDGALIAWGAFYFKLKGDPDMGRWKLIDDDDLDDFETSRTNLIGASSAPYATDGPAVVELTEKETGDTQTKLIAGANHAFFTGLKPDTTYTYTVTIDGARWGAGPLRNWEVEGDKGSMRRSRFSYVNEFRTFPDPAKESPDLTFAILGDFGRGVQTRSSGLLRPRAQLPARARQRRPLLRHRGSGKFDSGKPRASRFAEARTQAWGGNDEGHFVLAEIKGNRMSVVPYGNLADDALRPIKINVVTGASSVPPFEVEL